MAIIDKIKAKAASDVRTIVLPEGEEERNVQAASKISKAGLARIIMLGDPEKVKAVAEKFGVCLCGVEIINPATSDKAGAYAIQGGAAAFCEGLEGCYYNVMGFPVSRVARALAKIVEKI